MRADRLSVKQKNISSSGDIARRHTRAAGKMSPDAMVIDSIQTVYTEELMSLRVGRHGSECAAKAHAACKAVHILFIVGMSRKKGPLPVRVF